MRATFTVFFSFFLFQMAVYAQPGNDNCVNATTVTFNPVAPCPSTTPSTATVSGTNVNGTPTTPYPIFDGCSVGGSTTGPATEVWFTFTSQATFLNFSITGGLSTPQAVLYSGSDCTFLNAVDCFSATPGSGSLSVMGASVLAGQTYYLLVSGGDVNDQGSFTINFSNYNLCGSCIVSPPNLTVSPPATNGTYSSGTPVTFCYTITGWDVTGTIEWLHAVTIDFGPGWDYSTLIPNPPPSCGGDGSWGFFDSWVSCNTGQTFGPGFAYDSSSGIGCGGSPNDGNPGNNWGDGTNGCANIGTTAPPVTFCWTISVADDAGCIGGSPTDLSIDITQWTDGDSGSWTQTGCNTGVEEGILATAICCEDPNPLVFSTPTSCTGGMDGSISFEGQTLSGDPNASFNYVVFDQFGMIIYQSFGEQGLITIPNLPAGTYSVQATNTLAACQRNSNVTIIDSPPPSASASFLPACAGQPIQLLGDVIPFDPSAVFTWTGPGGPYIGQNPTVTQPGTYTLNVNVNGCAATPATVNVTVTNVNVTAGANPMTICEGGFTILNAAGDPSYSYDWGIYGTGPVINVPNLLTTTTFTVTATDPVSGCTNTADVTVNVNPLPPVEILDPGPLCQNVPFVLTAIGANTYVWEDGQMGPVAVYEIDQATNTTITVTGTDANGCTNQFTIPLMINPTPNGAISPDNVEVCGGQSIMLTASGGNNYSWSTNQNTATITVNPTVTTNYTVTVTDFNGCQDIVTTTVIVDQPVEVPNISCGAITPNSVTFNWDVDPDASGYTVNVLSGQSGGTAGSGTFFIDGLMPGEEVEIEVIALSGNSCPDASATLSCFAEDCASATVTINNAPASVCLTGSVAPIDLDAVVSGGLGGGTFLWTGPSLTNTTSSTVTFDPEGAGVGTHTIMVTYTEVGSCEYTAQVTINVFETPTANFTVSPGSICETGSSTVTYTGTATAGATYTWNFGGGTANPGTGVGPHTVSWATPGTKTISLTVEENGCTSTLVTQMVTVESELPAPNVSCGTITTTSVEFVWDDIPGADGFSVNVVTGQSGTQSGNSYTVTGLNPGTDVTIEVTALDNGPCPDVTTTFTCTSSDCPTFLIDLDSPQNDICLNGSNTPFNLTAMVDGGTGNGTGVWMGPGITDANNGTFDPANAGAGSHTITYTYTEGPCDASETIVIDVFETPTADFTVAPGLICTTGSTTVTYTGTASGGATYNWNFGGGTANPGTGAGPHTVSWATPGSKTISLTVTENGCTSTLFTQMVTVESPLPAPNVSCGTITTTSVEFVWDDIPGADNFIVNVVSGESGTQAGNTFTVTGLAPGTDVTIEVIAVDNGPCANSTTTLTCTSADCPTFNINLSTPQNDICLNGFNTPFNLMANVTGGTGGGTVQWTGTGITDAMNGTFDPALAGEGTHTITFVYAEGPCDGMSTIDITVFDTPTSDFTVMPGNICRTGTTTVTYTGDADPGNSTFTWNFNGGTAVPGTGAGPHTVSWATGGTKTITLVVTENGCTSATTSQTVTVDNPLAAPVINCNSTTSTITFTWNDVTGAVSYNVTVLQGPSGTQTGNSYMVTGLNPGDIVEIEVEAVGTGPCGNSMTTLQCVAEDCPDVTISLPTVDPICLDASTTSVDLDATITGGAGGGTETWSGTGITDSDNGIFDPNTAGPGDHTITINYQEGNCNYNQSLTITVNEQPTATFTAESPICITSTSTVLYTGSAAAGATYDWDFDGGTATPGTGPGPHEVEWATAGTKTISLVVTENDCASEPFTADVQVDAELAAPVINCNSSTTEITFSWNDVPGATGYDVQVLTGQSGTQSGNSFTVSNLNPQEVVTIRVTALGDGACGDSFAEQTCTAQDCPMVTLDITPVDDICLNDATVVVDLEVAISGGNGGGTETWSGTGITGAMDGIFDPNVAGEGSHTITFTYVEDNCSYNASITINVIVPPTADFTAESPICVDGTATITYTGTASAAATFTWDFGAGTATPGTGIGPHEVSWATGGTKTITLTVEENGCTSEIITQTVEVEEPLEEPFISCESTNTSITFVWNNVPGATGYDITSIFGDPGMMTSDTSYLVDNLEPGDSVRIRVTALGDGPCGDSFATLTCYAQDCPDITVTIDALPDLCTDSGLQSLTAVVTGGDGTGTLMWSGTGVIDAVNGTFDPSMVSGSVNVNVVYTQGVCTYSDSQGILVNEVPTADFMAETPICVDGTATITYTGTASAAATFNWDFDGGTATPGTGIGPHEVSWATGGTKTIALVVEENGCVSTAFSQTVEVEMPLAAPVIMCQTTNTSITFTWADVPGASGYDVTVLDGPTGTQVGNSYEVTGMMPGETVTLQVTALDDGPCANVSSETTCVAAECPDVTVSIDEPGNLCTDTAPIILTTTIEGGVGGGSFMWQGTGITDPATGLFDPSLVTGTTTVSVTYTEGVCTYSATLMITVNPVPIASFTADSPVCVDGISVVTFDGVASANASYTWDFGGGTATPGTGEGPHDVSWATAGTKTISLTVEDNGCTSILFELTVEVEAPLADPVVICEETTSTSILFSWSDVPGAMGYDVVDLSGLSGTIAGNTYFLDNLAPGQEVTIQVIALNDGPCGNSMGEVTCVAQDCPSLTLSLSGTAAICNGVSADPELTFDINAATGGPFSVEFTINGANNQTVVVNDGETITLPGITETSTIDIVSITDNSLTDCVYDGNASFTITVNGPVFAGTPAAPARVCSGAGDVFTLSELLVDADGGGTWVETSATPSTGGAFNAASGTFNTTAQVAGTYTFEYRVSGVAPCTDDAATVSVEIDAGPTADAGDDQTLTCNMGMVSIGGDGSTTGNVTYNWTSDDPDVVIADPTSQFIDVSQLGTYFFTVTNELGCIASDEVVVDANLDVPTAQVQVSEISCFEANDGAISITDVSGGAGGYEYSFDGGNTFGPSTQLANLGPAEYRVVIRDQNGCFSELIINLTMPEDITVSLVTNLGNEDVILLGDSVRLEAVFDPAINLDTLIWTPPSIVKDDGPVVWVNPTTTTNYSVTIIDENGCSDTDETTIFVRKNRPVFIPNVFSPNTDGFNDIFYIQGGDFINQIENFMIFNRWGESMFELSNFQPNDPALGWDGTFRGKPLNAGVYTYFAEISFDDGEVILYKGSVTLMR